MTLSGRLDPGDADGDRLLLDRIAELERDYLAKTEVLERLHKEAGQEVLFLTLSTGRSVQLSLDQVLAVSRPNGMHWGEKLLAYVRNLWLFVSLSLIHI